MNKIKKLSKRIFALVLTFTFLFGGMISVSAAEYTSGSYTYTVTDGKATITAYPETARGSVEIPSKLGGYPVTEIGAYAFYACTLIEEVIIPSKVTKIGDYAFAYCTSLSAVKIPSSVTSIGTNAFKNSNDVVIECMENSQAHRYAQSNDIEMLVIPSRNYPDWYDFDNDRYSFSNVDEPIDEEYYVGMFGESKGSLLFDYCEDGTSHGHCFGMAITTASTLVNCPYVTDYINLFGASYNHLVDVNKGTSNIDLDMTAKDFIKYGYVYQFSSAATQDFNASLNDFEGLYNAVYEYVYNDGAPVIVGLTGGPGGHEVYAIGIDGEDILINDSNEPDDVMRLDFTGDEWEYVAGGWTWNSSTSDLDYSTDVITPYLRLAYTIDVASVSTESYELDSDDDKLLLVCDSDAFEIDESAALKIPEGKGVSNRATSEAYWISDDQIYMRNISGSRADLSISGNDLRIDANLPKNSAVSTEIEDDKGQFEVTGKKGEDIEVTISSSGEGEEAICKITGEISSDTAVVDNRKDEIAISGLKNIKAIIEHDGKVTEINNLNDSGSTVVISKSEDTDSVPGDFNISESFNMNYKSTAAISVSGEGNIIWSSSDESVAKVDSNGNVTAVGTGTAIITATVEGTDISDSCEVTVSYAWWQWIIRILLLGFIWY